MNITKYIKFLPYVVIVVLALLLWSKGTPEDTTVVIPPITNTISHPSPKPITVYDTIKVKGKTEYVKVENPVNKELLNKYNSAVDSIAKLNVLKDAITERTYEEVYDDNFQVITVKSKVVGSLLNQKVDYTSKPQIVPFKTSKDKWGLYAGGSISMPITRSEMTVVPVVGANLDLVTNKNIFSLGINSNKTIKIGFAFKL